MVHWGIEEANTIHLGTSVRRSVKAFIQVLGPQRMPTSPKDPETREWYQKVSVYGQILVQLTNEPV